MPKGTPKKVKKNERTCKFCGVVFHAFPSAKRVVCSSSDCMYQLASTRSKRHGESRTRLYSIWTDMKARCKSSTKSEMYILYYVGRGIKVCEEWNRYENFRDWARSNGYSDNLELDRRDNNGNYEPENCRWATRTQQMHNTRKRSNAKTSKYKGVSKHSQNKSWIAQGHIKGKVVNIGSFKTEIEAAKGYDMWAIKNYKEFATPNFPKQN